MVKYESKAQSAEKRWLNVSAFLGYAPCALPSAFLKSPMQLEPT
jgi:hypothetical protein